MPLIQVSSAQLAFGDVKLLDNADLVLEPSQRIALIGRNGQGKSSLLYAISQNKQTVLDDGIIWWQDNLLLSYVEQEPTFLDINLSAYENLLLHLQNSLKNFAENSWNYVYKVDEFLTRFALDDIKNNKVCEFSGGQKKRLALAQAMITSPQVLLLDEPTNHLDINSIGWLENFLLNEKNLSLIFITHDRSFADKLATDIAELDRGKLNFYAGNFAKYLKTKEYQLNEEFKANERLDKKLKEEEIWIRKGVEARRTRAVFRVQRLEKLRQQRAERRQRLGNVNLQLDAGEKSGKIVAVLKNVCKKVFNENNAEKNSQFLVENLSLKIMRGDKFGIIAENGAGKTTLLKIILGELSPDSGSVKLGTKLQIAYFDQFRQQLDPEATLIDIISPGSDFIQIGDKRQHVIGYLGDFLFSPQRARSQVKSLSGGEKNRLLLARLFAKPANVLVLDEPTNDLDIETLELLETLLQDYSGTVLLVSHDRTFLDNVVTQTLTHLGNGVWQENVGGYSDSLKFVENYKKNIKNTNNTKNTNFHEKSEKISKKNNQNLVEKNQNQKRKLSFKEQQELKAIPQQIQNLENEQQQIQNELNNPATFENYEKSQQLTQRLAEIETQLLELLERWEVLENI